MGEPTPPDRTSTATIERQTSETGPTTYRCDRCREAIASQHSGVEAESGAETAPTATYVDETATRTVFEVGAVDCRGCATRIESRLEAIDGVYGATASYGTGSVGVYYDDEIVSGNRLASRLADIGHPVDSRDRAFANRRAKQWAGARFAAGILAGLMVIVPYVSVIYPARHEWLLGSAAAAHLQMEFGITGGYYFYLNAAVMSGVVLLFTGAPMLGRAKSGLRSGTITPELVAAGIAVPVYLYSSGVLIAGYVNLVDLTAQTAVLRFDVVVLTVVTWLCVQHALGLDVQATDLADAPDRTGDGQADDARRSVITNAPIDE